eukprot:g20910.t1
MRWAHICPNLSLRKSHVQGAEGGTFGAAVLCRDGEPAWRILIWLSLGSEKSCEHLTDGTEIVTAKNVAKEWDLFVWSL